MVNEEEEKKSNMNDLSYFRSNRIVNDSTKLRTKGIKDFCERIFFFSFENLWNAS